MENVASFGLGFALVEILFRLGGGIFSSAFELGGDLISRTMDSNEDSYNEEYVQIPKSVGNNVSEFVGNNLDFFSSFTLGVVACLIISSSSPILVSKGSYYFPLVLTSVCFGTSLLITLLLQFTFKSMRGENIVRNIKYQYILSLFINIIIIILICSFYLPDNIDQSFGHEGTVYSFVNLSHYNVMICPIIGLISSLGIGLCSEYYTSMSYGPVENLIEASKQGPGINIIIGLANGYMSTLLPSIIVVICVFFCYIIGGFYGITLGCLGLILEIPFMFAISGFGSITNNANCLAILSRVGGRTKKYSENLDNVKFSTFSFSKGFAIGFAGIIAVSLFACFVICSNVPK